MRTALLLSLALGCRPNPALDAWQGAIRIDGMTRADGACDAPPAETEPDGPYLFAAVLRGLPDSASLYWCTGPEACGAPFSNVWLTRLDPTHLEGELGTADTNGDLCSIRWDDLVAVQDGDQVEVVFRTGLSTSQGVGTEECLDLVPNRIGGVCDAVLAITGTRVE